MLLLDPRDRIAENDPNRSEADDVITELNRLVRADDGQSTGRSSFSGQVDLGVVRPSNRTGCFGSGPLGAGRFSSDAFLRVFFLRSHGREELIDGSSSGVKGHAPKRPVV